MAKAALFSAFIVVGINVAHGNVCNDTYTVGVIDDRDFSCTSSGNCGDCDEIELTNSQNFWCLGVLLFLYHV